MQDEQHPLPDDTPGDLHFADLPHPPPDDAWPHNMDDAPPRRQEAAPNPKARRFGFFGRAPAKAAEGVKRGGLGMRSLLVASLVGVAVIGYAQYGSKQAQIPDLLGTALPTTGLPEPAADVIPAIDPRLGEPEVRQLDLGSAEESAPSEPRASLSQVPAGIGVPHSTAPVPTSLATEQPTPQQAPTPEPSGPSNAELLEQLRQMQAAVAALSQQLGQVQQAQAAGASVARAAPTQAPASDLTAVRPTPQQRPRQAKAIAPRHAVQRSGKARAPEEALPVVAEKAATTPLAGQLVAVDMWNGEPSVVVASGLPGDRRLRVLRPGDVVNGLALKSADPVARSATFAVPGSPGLTLFVNQGG